MILDITKLGEEVLRKKAEPVAEVNDEIKKLGFFKQRHNDGYSGIRLGDVQRMLPSVDVFDFPLFMIAPLQILLHQSDRLSRTRMTLVPRFRVACVFLSYRKRPSLWQFWTAYQQPEQHPLCFRADL